jgi:5-methyltetrahydropteroyltriglutamate--homocysteine methyltransferase
MVHYRGGPAMLDPAVYPDIEGFWADLAAAYADEVQRLGALGCTYLQFDDTSLAYLNDPAQRAEISGRGEDADHMHLRYIKQINDAVKDKPAGMAITTHMCRGNFRSSWAASGGYDYVAEALFSELDVDGFFLEYDDERSGGFEPLRFVPEGKIVVLGLVTPSARSWSPRTISSAASTKPPSTCRWTSSACPASAASLRPPRATR